jgi:hypothetical protein
MSDEQSAGKMWMSVVAVIAIAVVGYFVYRQMQPEVGNLPEVNMSREEAMKHAMGGGPGAATPPKEDLNVPKTVDIKKSIPTP